ncbi:MAG: hypothetical protein ACJAYB_002663 [Psychromonas sp.]|jgi:hypothetical protein
MHSYAGEIGVIEQVLLRKNQFRLEGHYKIS